MSIPSITHGTATQGAYPLTQTARNTGNKSQSKGSDPEDTLTLNSTQATSAGHAPVPVTPPTTIQPVSGPSFPLMPVTPPVFSIPINPPLPPRGGGQ